ncbi:flagellar assembly protein FliH [Paenibacillus lentus]|uniref:Flagellar assembly protein FliH n=1 Tax=Paenibacillus lentus TaxID=1338368 RepID=A0A3Q8S5T1_9BACL|nr:flagellar assembly protein FliH [Paenibacillus lentus]AZK47796.1 flagellar assembly protein FliH [Paenibacillus lentus]
MSNLIKVSQYVPVDILKQLNLGKSYETPQDQELDDEISEAPTETVSAEDLAAEETRRQMLSDAKEFAERQIREASEQAENMLAEAKLQIESWWQEQREQDEDLIEALKSEGFSQGYEEGKLQAEQSLQAKIEQMIGEASAVLEQAYAEKERIIQEAEPFVVELSCSIAEKVIDKQLALEPDYVLDIVKKSLARKREQGVIALCVSPAQYAFVQASREELNLVIDSQADLQILPDASVQDRGCVIRSAFGSVDARIDTQLAEIKKELLRISLDNEDYSGTSS